MSLEYEYYKLCFPIMVKFLTIRAEFITLFQISCFSSFFVSGLAFISLSYHTFNDT